MERTRAHGIDMDASIKVEDRLVMDLEEIERGATPQVRRGVGRIDTNRVREHVDRVLVLALVVEQLAA